jgi:UDP-N-acetylglucosamine--N-acetylmuramyl-(pentapeptide) pyrophosphoryl-undecaprenol N-acetylglucosamine transferase
MTFLMAGGGTGGHVIPAIAVARELERRGHRAVFAGTLTGMDARLVPAAGFPIEWIEIGGLKRVGIMRLLRTAAQLPSSVWKALGILRRYAAAGVFSMGGYAAGPPVLAALVRRLPVVLMEPNAMPGFTNRSVGRFAARALVSFEETLRWFPAGRGEVTGLPVREDFFRVGPKPPGESVTVLITGGSQGSRTLNRAARESWPRFRSGPRRYRLIHQTGPGEFSDVENQFAESGVEGRAIPFIDDMARVFAESDVVVCRAGAGAVAELAAAGKPSVLVPFPFAADDHQTRNAEVMARAGAARMVADRDLTGDRLFEEVDAICHSADGLRRMGEAARRLARPGAAAKAADALEECGVGR